MGWIGELVYGFLRAVLPWLFSGSEEHTTSSVVGLDDLDSSTLAGNKDMSAKDLPPFSLMLVPALLFALSGCTFGGGRTDYKLVFVEPGGVVRVGTDKKLPIVAKDAQGNDVYEERSIAGFVALPVSVYRELRANWEKRNAELNVQEVPASQPAAQGQKK